MHDSFYTNDESFLIKLINDFINLKKSRMNL